jgi:4,5-DOPA dioxygenase extradiol
MSNKDLTSGISSEVTTESMPVFFVGHGSPMNAIEHNEFTKSWQEIGMIVPKPKAILCVSAHWETLGTRVTAMKKPRTIHDFGGFPQKLYEVEYPAPGNQSLATEIKDNIKNSDVALDESWGLDHGAWSVIKHIYPGAEVPVLEMSLDYNKSPLEHLELASELSNLRKKGVLIIGSGNMVHNLGMIAWNHAGDPEYGYDWSIEANDIFKRLIISGNNKDLASYKNLGREVQLAVPSPDHFLPMLYALALKEENEVVTFFNDKAVMGSLTMTSFRIG